METKIVEKPEIGDPTIAITFLFTMITILYWGMFQGILKNNTILIIGLTQLACFPGYIIGSIIYFVRGDALNGSVYMIFATLFAGVGGLANIATYVGVLNGLGLDGSVSSMAFLWGGLALIPVCIVKRKEPILPLSMFVVATLFLIVYPLVVLGYLPLTLMVVVKWMALWIAVEGLYSLMSGIMILGGCKGLPMGPSIIK